jgi:hypothetical protein
MVKKNKKNEVVENEVVSEAVSEVAAPQDPFADLEKEVAAHVVATPKNSTMGGSRLNSISVSEACEKYGDTEHSSLFERVVFIKFLILSLIYEVCALRDLQLELKTTEKLVLKRAESQHAIDALASARAGIEYVWEFGEGRSLTLNSKETAAHVVARHTANKKAVDDKVQGAKMFPLWVYVLELLETEFAKVKAECEAERALASAAYLDLASVMSNMPWANLPRGFTQAKNDRHKLLMVWAENKLALLESGGDVDTSDSPTSEDTTEDTTPTQRRKAKEVVVDETELADLSALL